MSSLAEQWSLALAGLEVRHPNGRSKPIIRVIGMDPPELYVGLDIAWCTMTGRPMEDFAISTVRLTHYPGENAARRWFAAAWAGYCQHEALELVTLEGNRSLKVLDPHEAPYETNRYNRGLRVGFPIELTPDTLRATMRLIDDEAT